MPIIEDLVDRIYSKTRGTVWSTSIDLRYAYGQLILSRRTARQSNFSLVGGAATGTYRFRTGFYGLADMPAELHQAIYRILIGTKGTNAFVDVILTCTKGTIEEHMPRYRSYRKNLTQLNIQIFKFAQQSVDWLGLKLAHEEAIPLKSKIEGLIRLQASKMIKQLRGLMGSAHQLNEFIPNLATLCWPFRDFFRPHERNK